MKNKNRSWSFGKLRLCCTISPNELPGQGNCCNMFSPPGFAPFFRFSVMLIFWKDDILWISVWPNPSLLSWLVCWIDIRTFGKPHGGLSSHHNNIYVLFYYDKSTMDMTMPMMTRGIAKTMMMMMMIVYLLGGQPPVMVFQVPLICPHRSKQHFLDVYTLSRTASISRPQLKKLSYISHISLPKTGGIFCECVLWIEHHNIIRDC